MLQGGIGYSNKVVKTKESISFHQSLRAQDKGFVFEDFDLYFL
jgi:hypothetical protein